MYQSSKNAFQILPEGGDVLFITPFWKVGFQEFLELLLHLCNPRDARVPVLVHSLFGNNEIEQVEKGESTYVGSSLPVKSTSETSVLAPVLVLKWENFSFFYPDRSSQCQKSHNFHTKLFVRAAHRTHPYQYI